VSDKPQGAVIEIIEKNQPNELGVVVPQEIRINGQPLLSSSEYPIKVHEIELNDGDLVLVTLTLFARRVSIGYEAELPSS
jgi:flagellar biosynthesis component FlhA